MSCRSLVLDLCEQIAISCNPKRIDLISASGLFIDVTMPNYKTPTNKPIVPQRFTELSQKSSAMNRQELARLVTCLVQQLDGSEEVASAAAVSLRNSRSEDAIPFLAQFLRTWAPAGSVTALQGVYSIWDIVTALIENGQRFERGESSLATARAALRFAQAQGIDDHSDLKGAATAALSSIDRSLRYARQIKRGQRTAAQL